MTELPSNYSQPSGRDLHNQFRNFCIEFKKVITSSQDRETLEEHMEQFFNFSKEMVWKTNDAEKTIEHLWSHFKRHIKDPSDAHTEDLLVSLAEIEKMIDAHKVV